MRVLITGGNGFVGSHLLEGLLKHGHRLTVLLRETSDTRFIEHRLPEVRVEYGELREPQSLHRPLKGAEAVVHCAAKTKAVQRRDYYAVNETGTANMVAACNEAAPGLRHFVLISSLAVSGPGTLDEPAREDDEPRPVTDYGRSKLLAERCVRRDCRAPWTVLRPAAVYGPRDRDFFLAFKGVRGGLVPLLGGGGKALSLVFVADVVGGVLAALGREDAFGGTYHLAHPEPVTQEQFLGTIARQMGVRPLYLPLPTPMLYVVCLSSELRARLTRSPSILNLQKVPEYTAGGWVCSTERARRELGFVARVPVEEGVARTLRWYRSQGWLPVAEE
ncbi:MAG: NAD-dependent epimerase/dehydratase family protein [Planctomycetota bacterium]